MPDERDVSPKDVEFYIENLRYERSTLAYGGVRAVKGRDRTMLALYIYGRYVAGETLDSIASDLDISHGTAHTLKMRALDTIELPTTETARKTHLDQCDRILSVWMPKAEGGDEKAAAVVAKFLDLKAKVTGGYAPIQVETQVTEITAQERELQDMIAEQERANKARETELKSRL